jgi:carboxymethylenebutenolidase
MNHMQRYLAEEAAEDYLAGRLSRRQALKLIASLTGSVFLAGNFLAACAAPPANPTATHAPATAAPTGAPTSAPAPTVTSNTPATTAATTAVTGAPTGAPTNAPAGSATPGSSPAAPYGTVVPADPAVSAGPVTFPGSGATLMGYQAVPQGAGPFPMVLVCHENRGLTAHIQDVTRRFAKAGYAALAVDLLARQGGSAQVGESGAPGTLGAITPAQFVADFSSGYDYLKTQPLAAAGRLGMVGFCFGGGVTWLVAEGLADLKAAVPFYGPPPPAEQVPNIHAAVLAMYGGDDSRITSTEPAMESAMQQAGKTFDKMIYPGAGHAFFNDTGASFNLAAAQDAWSKTLAWFGKYV